MAREYLQVLTGPLQGTEVEIVGSLTVGRSPDNAFQLNDLQVSRRHALIQQTPAGTVVRDLGSGNGTFVGDKQVVEHRLRDGDIVRIGNIELRYRRHGVLTPPQAPQKPEKVRFQQEEAGGTLRAAAVENVYQTFFHARRGTATADQLAVLQERLAAIYEANQVISSERDLEKVFGRILEQIFELIPAETGVIMLDDPASGKLTVRHHKSKTLGEITVSMQIVRRAFERGEAAGASIMAQNITSAMCTPLIHQGERLGVIYVDARGFKSAFTQSDLELLVAFSGPAAIAIKNAQYVDELERKNKDTVTVLANAIEARDHYTIGHTLRVTNFAIEMARAMGWDEERLKDVQLGGVLHDVGKLAVNDAILGKREPLTDQEYEKMKVHPERGASLMQDSEFLMPLIPYALYHHERFDGKGYPFKLSGEQIPIEGRLIAVADAFDAMTSNRPYRKGLDPEVAIAEIQKGAGSQFDPACVEALVQCYRRGQIDRILQDFHKRDKMAIACPFCSTYVALPRGVEVGSVFKCGVCHRSIRLEVANEVYYGERVAETDARVQAGGADANKTTSTGQPLR